MKMEPEYKPSKTGKMLFGVLCLAAAYTGLATISQMIVKNSKVAKAMNIIRTEKNAPDKSRSVYEDNNHTNVTRYFELTTEKTDFGQPKEEVVVRYVDIFGQPKKGLVIRYVDMHPKGLSEGDILTLTHTKCKSGGYRSRFSRRGYSRFSGKRGKSLRTRRIPGRIVWKKATYKIDQILGVYFIREEKLNRYERPMPEEDRNKIFSDLEKKLSQKGPML